MIETRDPVELTEHEIAVLDVRSHIADALMELRYTEGTPEWEEQRGNYLLDAGEVINLLPHLLPLDVREAMFGEEESA